MTRILCIEDEPDVRSDVVEELLDAGYETDEASDGEAGLAAILNRVPDLVLCDISMPKMTGFELLEALRRDHPDLADLPFIFLTAFADRDSQLTGRRLGVDDYLTKPIDFEMLLASVESRLESRERLLSAKDEQLVDFYRMMFGGEPETADAASEAEAIDVVLVASERDDAAFVENLAGGSGISLRTYAEGQAFLDSLEGGEPDVLLVSYRTNDMSADDVVKRTKLGGAFGFPIIIVYPPQFAHLSQTDIAGADDTIVLPCEPEELVAKINRPRVEWKDVVRYL